METIGPATRRNALGPLRRLFWTLERPRPRPRGRIWSYATPLGLFALTGLGIAGGNYLSDNRTLPTIVVVILAAGSALPVAVAFPMPVLAWRLSFPMLFLGVINEGIREPWPWNVVQILGFLFVLGRFAVTQDSALTAWATALSLIPVFLFAPDANAWGAAILLIAIAALGDIVFRRRRTLELLAEHEEITELERARRAVLEERARIAREMHDVVAHHMSMIAVRAETAPWRLPDDLPASARDELAAIASSARDALTDMRRLLAVLRADNTGATPTAPQPGLADLNDLVAATRAAGMEVELALDGGAGVPETVGLAAYRIVQEALANAARHAPGSPVFIAAREFPGRLELTVRNPLAGPVNIAGGHGLTGMRERAMLLGGELAAQPVESDFMVAASLPFSGSDANDQGADRGRSGDGP